MKHHRELEIRAWCDDGGDLRKAYIFVKELLIFITGLRETNITLNRMKETFEEARDKWIKSSDKYQVMFDRSKAKLEYLTEHLKTHYKCIGGNKRHIDGNCLHCLGKYLMLEKEKQPGIDAR